MGGRGPAQAVAPLQAKAICVLLGERRDRVVERRENPFPEWLSEPRSHSAEPERPASRIGQAADRFALKLTRAQALAA